VITTSINDIKERLSVAYVVAVAARAGCQVRDLVVDKQSIDALICPVSGRKTQVNLQLKATSEHIASGGQVKLSIPIKNYDDLRATDSIVPHYLVVLQLPEAPEEWLTVNAEELAIRRTAYYGNLYGLPAVSPLYSP
jgi:hypothetical protein